MSDFDWIEQHDINPWEIYDAILFDIYPSEDDVIKYINMALDTHEITNRDAWGNRHSNHVLDIFHDKGVAYLRIDRERWLLQGNVEKYLNDNHVIKYSELVGNQLMESDDWGWAREIPDSIPFNQLEVDKKYKYVPNQNFYGAVESCVIGNKISDWITYVKVMITLYDESEKIPYNNIYCHHKRQDRVSHVVLRIYDDEGNNIRFAVTEDMGEFYPLSEQSLKDLLKLDLNEFEDDFDWVRETPINPWDMYDSIDFDIVPTDEEVNRYIELALQTREISNRDAWGSRRKFDIDSIIGYARDGDCELTIMYSRFRVGHLAYGPKTHSIPDNRIKYSELKSFNINESEDDGLDWIREVDPRPRIEVGRKYDVHNDHIDEFLEAVELSGLNIIWASGQQPTTYYPTEDDRGSTVINIGNDHRLSYWSDYGNRNTTNLIKWPNTPINESDEMDWIRDTNPEDIDTISFFQHGKCYYMGKLINKDLGCIKFEKYDPKDEAHSYEDGRGLLQFGTYWYSPLYIEKKLKEKNLTLYDLETEENLNLMESDEMDWIRNTEIPIQPGTIYKSSDEQTLREILRLIEDKFPEATWMSGSKPTGFFPALDDYFGRRRNITRTIVFQDDYSIYFHMDDRLDDDEINYQLIEL